MNYQPFLNMNILISDPMLQALQGQTPALLLLALLTFLSFYLAFRSLELIICLLVKPKTQHYPPHDIT